MSTYSHVFSPLKIGPVEVKNRIESAPTLICMASPEGWVTREMIAYYQNLARGGAGIITIGETPIDFEYAKGHEHQLNLGDDKVIAGLSVLAEAVHRYGAVLSIELCHNGRQRLNRRDAIAPSPLVPTRDVVQAQAEGRKPIRVMEMDQDMIERVIENYAAAAERCMKAGLQMIMIHGAHGHLIAQFLSPFSNKRTDHYGGSLENRARFAIEVLTAVRKRVGNKVAIEYRISANEMVPGGMTEDETIEFVKMIQDKVDLLHVSVGMVSEPVALPHMIQPTYLPHCYNVQRAERFKKALDIPVTVVGSVMDLDMAEKIIAEGKADIVAMARALIADREAVNKTRRGRQEDVRPCIRCLTCVRVTGTFFYPIRCTINPVIGRELDYSRMPAADAKKKVVVLGGGPAGMEAALVASSRGHEVVLFEKGNTLGGNLILAAGFPFKGDMRRYLEWLIRQTEKASGVTIRLNCEASREEIAAEEPDVVLVAVGAEPIIPDVPGVDKPHVIWAGDVIRRGCEAVGDRAVIVGGGVTGCETALYLAQSGKKEVTIVDVLEERQIGADAPRGLVNLLHEHHVRLVPETKLEGIDDTGLMVLDREWRRYVIPADTVILSTGFKPRQEVVEELKGVAPEVYAIGDCRQPGNLYQAIHDAFNVAVEI